MVRPMLYRKPRRPTRGRLNCTAEEYYKNDYPDEESSDYDGSEGNDGAYPARILVLRFCWKQLCGPVDPFRDDSDGYDDDDD
jgi:hypothetical protein